MGLDIHKVKSATTILLALSSSCDVYAFLCFTKACRPSFTCLKYHLRILNEKWIQLNCTLTQEVYCNFFLNVEVYGKIRYNINQSGSGSSWPYQLCPFVSIKILHIIGQENNIITFYIKKHQRP